MSYHFSSGGIRLPAFSRGNRKTQVGSTKHFTGGLVLGDQEGVRLGTESHLETNAALVLGYRPNTLDLVEQVQFAWYDEHGEFFDHFIDLVVTRIDGTVCGYAVRPASRVSQAYECKLARIKEQAIAQCFLDDFRLFTEEDVCPVELHNAKLFHSVRRPDAFADPVARDVLANAPIVTTIGDLVDRTRLEGMGFRAVARLIRSGHLQMLRHERIERSTEVLRARMI
ncbi:hypothetical protein [Tateyamaria omphalii]|uniref:TnsA endonuclease N-terminal domain-containing protein n=1 Tax=Tateyamaria omphalii TaxID=299262 RepID=A0A1P8MWI3_9RHOB|nr:hypothetical protein [Tateyamaria omphalii]APX12424.1 hypothetical protein BWR18_12610 [Tateyamaria omphalii]